MLINKYISNKAYRLSETEVYQGKKIASFIFLLGGLFILSILISAHYYDNSSDYHEEYFTEEFCYVIDDNQSNENILDKAKIALTLIPINNITNKKTEKAKVKNPATLFEQKMPTRLPVDKKYSVIASPFGWRKHPILKIGRIHEGIDFDAPYGAEVYASGSGTIIEANYSGGYGKIIKIKHTENLESRYAHLSKLLVKKGQTVKRGDLIGKVGNTGLSTTAHLHYEIRVNSKAVNPVKYYK